MADEIINTSYRELKTGQKKAGDLHKPEKFYGI